MTQQDPTSDPKLHHNSAPAGYMLRGVSTLMDSQGRVKGAWVKTQRRALSAQEIASAYADAVKMVKGPKPRDASPTATFGDRMCVYPLGDPHIGMLAWHEEAGKNWDLKIAVQTHADVLADLASHTPNTHHAVLANLGDMLHGDGYGNTTTAGTTVDVDVRYPKMLRAAVAMTIGAVDQLLVKHEHVTVINVRGNHDTNSAVALNEIMRAHYRQELRVTVRSNVPAHQYVQWGANLLGFHHGDKTKPANLPLVMATDRPVLWGKTRHRRWLLGHVHHEAVKEFPGCVVESFGVLPPADAWHRGQGYRSRQRAVADVLHAEHGKVARFEVTL